eukprot:9228414-Pyramimonas_sp.AAC.1
MYETLSIWSGTSYALKNGLHMRWPFHQTRSERGYFPMMIRRCRAGEVVRRRDGPYHAEAVD